MFFILHAQHLTQLNFIANTILCQAQLRYTSSISHNSFLIKTRISKAIFYYKILILWISTVSVSAYEPKPPYILHAQIRHKQFYYQIRTDNPYHTGQRENRSHQVGRRNYQKKNHASLILQATYNEWDFSSIWGMSPDINNGFPYIQTTKDFLQSIAVKGIEISENNISLSIGESGYLSAAVLPFNASNQTITWSSSDDNVASVSAAGKVTAISAGTATITAATEDGGYEDSCIVTVTERFADEYQINSIAVRDSDGEVLSVLPDEVFLATVSITNLASEGNTHVLLAAYTDAGQYQGMMWVSIEDLSVGATCKVTLPVDNSDGKIENLKAFTVASFSNLTPLGDVVSFLTE